MMDASRVKRWCAWSGLGLVGLIGLLLVLFSLLGPIHLWPQMDESTFLHEARRIAQGELPYRDFYNFLTPGSQLFAALFIRLNGFSIVGMRILAMVGWLVGMAILYEMLCRQMSMRWRILFVAFLWLTVSRYPVYQHHLWSGLTALAAVFFVWKHLQQVVYGGQQKPAYLALAGVFCALTFWVTESLGVFITAALGAFSLLHCFLHEREEKGVGYYQLTLRQVVGRWWKQWGLTWLLPLLGVHAICVGLLWALGLWPDFYRDAIQWLAEGHYRKTTIMGYFSTFNQEFLMTIRPLFDRLDPSLHLLFLHRVPVAIHLFLIGVLPVLGLLVLGYRLPNRFVYRLLQQNDEVMLLFWISALAMILSTMSYSNSMHLVSNGLLAFGLGWLVWVQWLERRPVWSRIMFPVTSVFLGLLLLCAVVGSFVQVVFGTWLPPFKHLPETLLYTGTATPAPEMLKVVNRLNEAEARNEYVFIFAQSHPLYLVGGYRSATRFSWILPQLLSKTQEQEMMRDLRAKRPLYIVDDQSLLTLNLDPRYSKFSPKQLSFPELGKFLRASYEIQDTFGVYVVYRRKDALP